MNRYDRWTAQHIPRFDGKTVLVTGANSGLGHEAAKLLAERGAAVIMAVRDRTKGEAATAQVRAAAPDAQLHLLTLDLADLASIGRFAEDIRDSHDRLDVLINNAGVMAIPRRLTADGFEMQFGTNHLGHFALTGLLLPLLQRTPLARVVTMSSGVHVMGRINFADLQSQHGYSDWRAYAQSKLANLLFAYELQRKLAAVGAGAISLAAHPGYAATNLQLVGPAMYRSRGRQAMMRVANRIIAQSAAMGALPAVYAAIAPAAQGGDYYGPGGPFGVRGFPRKVRSSPASHDQPVAARLWQVSEELTGVSYRFA